MLQLFMAFYLVNQEYLPEILDNVSISKIGNKNNRLGKYRGLNIYADTQVNGLVKLEDNQLSIKTPEESLEKVEVKKDGDTYELSLKINESKYVEKIEYNPDPVLEQSEIEDRKHWLKDKKWRFVKDVRSNVLNQLDYTKAL